MSNDTRTITIKAFRDGSPPDGYRFEMLPAGQPNTDRLTFNKDHDGMKTSDKYKVTFQLVNDPSSNLRFINDKKTVMWVSRGTPTDPGPCPEIETHDPEFEVKDVEDFSLKVENKDDVECQFKFVLNFVGLNSAGETALIPFDPIWDNKNGGQQAKSAVGGVLVLGFASGAALGAIATYLALQA